MDDIARIQYVTKHYAQLQGLRIVPLGAVFLLLPLHRSGVLGMPPGIPFRLVVAGAVALACLTSFAIQRAYRTRLGDVRHNFGHSGAIPLMGFFVILAFLAAVDDAVRPVVSLPGLAIAVALARIGIAADGLRRHYLPLAGAVLIVANLRWIGIPPHIAETLVDLIAGGALIIGGIGDHLVLTRTLQRQSHASAL